MESVSADAIPAATLIVVRDRPDAPPDLLTVTRAPTLAFAGGATAFPGGRVDPGDRALAATLGGDADEDAHRVAAVREAIEEVGLALGLVPMPDAATLAALRAALHAGTPFARALTDARLTLDLTLLTPWARWRPAHAHARIFDTRFYLAALPAAAPPLTIDGTEHVGLRWASARQVLADADAGRLRIIFPTRRNLERLAPFGCHADLVAHARAHPIGVVTPWEEERGGVVHLCIPADAGYPVTSEPLTAALRG